MSPSLSRSAGSKRVFRVIASSTDYPTILVVAASVEEAWSIARSMDGEYFAPDEYDSEWQIIAVDVVDKYDPLLLAPAEAYGSP